MRVRRYLLPGLIAFLSILLVVLFKAEMGTEWIFSEAAECQFNGERALQNVIFQVELGARTPGSQAHSAAAAWIQTEMYSAGWHTRLQPLEYAGYPLQNIIAYRTDEKPTIILATHYDSRLHADHDPEPDKRMDPVPGANDGASGTAILLELGRILTDRDMPVWLVFFDAEDNGNLPGWDWILGSRAFVTSLEQKPQAVIVVDMVGDADLNIYMEMNSNWLITKEIWAQAAELGYEAEFIPRPKHSLLDDHTSFLDAGIPAALIIDFDYPYWHTTADTPDKLSAQSMKITGETLCNWLVSHK